MSRSAGSAAPTAATARTLGGKNHLQQFVWIFEEIPELVALRAEHFLCQLRRHFDARNGRILRHIADLVDLDARFSRQRRLQLFRQ
jgi:hypothetical protein